MFDLLKLAKAQRFAVRVLVGSTDPLQVKVPAARTTISTVGGELRMRRILDETQVE